MRRITHVLPRYIPVLIMALTALSLVPEAGFAQLGPTFRSAPKLSQQDIAIIRKVVRQDLEGKPNGTTLPWSNPQSQNHGTVTLIDRFPSQGRDCRKVKYFINPGPSSQIPTTYVLTSCKLADGSWKMDNAAAPDKSQ